MTAAGTIPDAWKEVCLIGIIPEANPSGAGGGSEIAFAGITEDITAMDWGDKEIEGRPLINGGNVVQCKSMTEESVTLKIFDVDALLDDASDVANGVAQMFHPQTTEDSTQPVLVDNTWQRRKFGVILLWAEALPATAGAIPAESKAAYRIQIINAYMTRWKPNYDDKTKSAEVTFKWVPTNKSAVANKREESTDGSESLPAAITSATTAFG